MNKVAAHKLKQEMNAAEALKAQLLTMTDDEDVVRDTIEGETDLRTLIEAVNISMIQDHVIVHGCKAQITLLKARKERSERTIATKRAMIEQAMSIGEITSEVMGTATFTLRKVPPKLEITDESKIPLEYWTPAPPPDPILDKQRLEEDLRANAALIQAGEKPAKNIPGATLDNGGVSLTIRQK